MYQIFFVAMYFDDAIYIFTAPVISLTRNGNGKSFLNCFEFRLLNSNLIVYFWIIYLLVASEITSFITIKQWPGPSNQ